MQLMLIISAFGLGVLGCCFWPLWIVAPIFLVAPIFVPSSPPARRCNACGHQWRV